MQISEKGIQVHIKINVGKAYISSFLIIQKWFCLYLGSSSFICSQVYSDWTWSLGQRAVIPLNVLLEVKFKVTVLCHKVSQLLLTMDCATLSSPETIRKENKIKTMD